VDIQTGRAAGVETVAALWGYRTREILEKEGPSYLSENPIQILDLV
jgi:phosphoglycolate phosphatase-like HAD superfamily hydrolase